MCNDKNGPLRADIATFDPNGAFTALIWRGSEGAALVKGDVAADGRAVMAPNAVWAEDLCTEALRRSGYVGASC